MTHRNLVTVSKEIDNLCVQMKKHSNVFMIVMLFSFSAFVHNFPIEKKLYGIIATVLSVILIWSVSWKMNKILIEQARLLESLLKSPNVEDRHFLLIYQDMGFVLRTAISLYDNVRNINIAVSIVIGTLCFTEMGDQPQSWYLLGIILFAVNTSAAFAARITLSKYGKQRNQSQSV